VSSITTYMLLQGDMLRFSPIERGRVFMSMQESCIIVDENGHIVDVNQRVKKLLPFLPDDIIGKKATDVFHHFPCLRMRSSTHQNKKWSSTHPMQASLNG